MLKNRIAITMIGRGCFEADILLEQKPYFTNCYSCTGDGRQTFIKTIKEVVNMAKMEEVSTRSRIGIAIKKALFEKFDGRYLCEDCATKKWKITIPLN